MRCVATGDDVYSTVTCHIRGDQIFGCHAAGIDQMFLPLRARVIGRIVDLDSVDLGRIAMAKDDLVRAVSVDIGRPEGMAAAETLVDDVPCPQLTWFGGRRVDDERGSVHWFDRRDKCRASRQSPRLNLARPVLIRLRGPRALRTQGNVLAVLRCRPDGSVIFSPDGNGAFWSDEHVHYRPGSGVEHAGMQDMALIGPHTILVADVVRKDGWRVEGVPITVRAQAAKD